VTEKNPFTVSFGRPPLEYVSRVNYYDKVMETFTELPVTDQIYIISGVRGIGKTVLFSSLLKDFRKRRDWIVIQLNTYDDMTQALYSELYYDLGKHDIQVDVGLGIADIARVSVHSAAPKKTISSLIRSLLQLADRHGQNVLIAVDDISKSAGMKKLSKLFQEMIGDELPLYFLGTGIPENIDELKNVKDLTFLYRAPRIILEPLDLAEISFRYQRALDISTQTANRMAKMTKGYSFAFQALGYIYWENKPVEDLDELMPEYDRLLTSASYSKMWTELSNLDKNVCRAIAMTDSGKVKEIRENASMDSNLFNAYRNRLRERGMIDTSKYGQISFTLPRFAEFVNNSSELYD
jgi:hypothetical protein